MKTARLLLLAPLLLLFAWGPATPAKAQSVTVSAEIDFGFFYDRLSPHGSWQQVPDYGWCWHPREVEADWRPYSHGNWVYSDDCGWYFHSDYEWSWAGHHYGRWVTYESSWHWVPGYEWSGAWVAWRNGGGYVGWAPLPPRAEWEVGVGIRTTNFSYESDIRSESWVFVSHDHFVDVNLHSVVIKSRDNTLRIGGAPVIGSVSVSGGVVVNRSVSLDVATKFSGKTIRSHKVRASATLGEAALAGEEDEIRVFRPKVKKGDATPPDSKDTERISGAERKTLREKHDAEDRELPIRQQKSGKDEKGRQAEREDIDRRHKQESDDLEKRHGKAPDREPGKEPGREPKEPGKEPKQPGHEPRDPGQNPKEPSTEPKEPGQQPRDPKEPGTEPREPKEPKEPREPKEPKEPKKEPGKGGGKD